MVFLPLLCDNLPRAQRFSNSVTNRCALLSLTPSTSDSAGLGTTCECAFLTSSQAVWTLGQETMLEGAPAWIFRNTGHRQDTQWRTASGEGVGLGQWSQWMPEVAPSRDVLKSVGPLWRCWYKGVLHSLPLSLGCPKSPSSSLTDSTPQNRRLR